MFECNQCSKSFATAQALGSHNRRHQNPRWEMFDCLYCKKPGLFDTLTAKGKFCSLSCQGAYKRAETYQKVIEGTGTASALKNFLIEENGYQCSICSIKEWQGKPISLHLDHIDGNSDNNRLDNGRILCPNCHSQTATFSGRNTKNTKRNRYLQQYKAEKKQKR